MQRAADTRATSGAHLQLLALALGLGVTLLWFWGVLLPAALETAPTGFGPARHWDLETYFIPKYVFGSEELRRGFLPVWNRFEFGGIPFLATAQAAAVYPLKILVFGIWPSESAMHIFLAIHSALLGLFFLVFARAQGLGPVGTFAGAVAYSFNIQILSATGHPMEIANVVWLPLLFLAGEHLGRTGRPASLALLAAVVAVQLTAGYPGFVLDCAVLLAVHAVVRHATGAWTRPPWLTLPLLATAFGLGGIVAAVQVLPLADLVLVSGRLSLAEAVASRAGDLPLLLALSVIASFPGLLAVAAAGFGRRSLAPLAGALVCLFMILGGWRLLRLLPGFAAARMPGTWPFLAQLFLAWLVALGADALVRSGPAARPAAAARLLGATVALSWIVVCLFSLAMSGSWGGGLLARVFTFPTPELATRPVTAAAANAAGGVLALLLLLAGPPMRRTRTALALVAIAAVTAGQLSAFPFGRPLGRLAPPENPHRSTSLIPEPELRRGRVLSMIDARGGYHLLDRVENPFGREGSLPPPRFTKLERRLRAVVQTARIDWPRLLQSPGLLPALDIRYAVTARSLGRRFEAIGFHDTGWGDEKVGVFATSSPLGRAWGVYGATVVEDPDAALERLLAADFDPAREVILEQPPSRPLPARASIPASPARVSRPAPTFTEVEVDMRAAGILVLADSCFPGWETTVDGEPAELRCANYLVRGVELDAGAHRVRFTYRPASLHWGVRLSVAGGLMLLALVLVSRQRTRPTEVQR
ncbi:MAG: hypothetical protein ACE5FG_04375 [Myxococcota bacterium]